MKLLLTRHGQTDWNVLGKIQGITDTELNEVGINQAEQTHELLKNTKIDLVISSPLKRAYKTAEIIIGSRNIPLITDDRIKERDCGALEGKEGKKVVPFWVYGEDPDVEGLEKLDSLIERVADFLDDIKEKYKDKTVLIVTHGGISIPVRYYFKDEYEGNDLHQLAIRNCEVLEYNL